MFPVSEVERVREKELDTEKPMVTLLFSEIIFLVLLHAQSTDLIHGAAILRLIRQTKLGERVLLKDKPTKVNCLRQDSIPVP